MIFLLKTAIDSLEQASSYRASGYISILHSSLKPQVLSFLIQYKYNELALFTLEISSMSIFIYVIH